MIPIVFSTDHNYVMPTGITILSLLLTNKNTAFDIYVLCANDVSECDRELLRKQVYVGSKLSKINFIDIGDEFKNGYEIRGISTACYYRLLIPWLLPQYDKVIYSDVDIIFMSEISAFYQLDLSGLYLAGVNTPGFVASKRIKNYISKLNLNPTRYINSGFILLNTKLIREHNLKDKFTDLANRKLLFQDQDILNIVAKDKILLADPNYNIGPRRTKPHGKTDIEDVIVLHYAGDKPWKTITYRWGEWWSIYNKSIFYSPDFCEYVTATVLNPKYYLQHLWNKFKYKYLHL